MADMAKKDTLTRLREKERQLRQSLIIEAARKVFGEKTFDRVSMAEIAEAAGIAKSSIYTYFRNQEELYARIAFQDATAFISNLEAGISENSANPVKQAVEYFLDYYIANESQWKMITHFALHGNKNMESIEQLNEVGRALMNVFEKIFIASGCTENTRLLSHTLFACLSGVLISFRNYPGRSEDERIAHMKKIGAMIESMINALTGQANSVPGT